MVISWLQAQQRRGRGKHFIYSVYKDKLLFQFLGWLHCFNSMCILLLSRVVNILFVTESNRAYGKCSFGICCTSKHPVPYSPAE